MFARVFCFVTALTCLAGAAQANNLRPHDPVALRNVVDETMRELLVPGAMVLLRTPQGEFVYGFGATELGGSTTPRAATHFRIASNTKTMTAAVIVLLAQEGKLRFDDPVGQYITGVPNGGTMTVGDLLRMRSGLYNYTASPEMAQGLDTTPDKAWTPEELLAIAWKRPVSAPPDSVYDYCNTNYVLLGLVAEKLYGAPLARIFQERLFAPLGLKNTQLPQPASNAMPEPYAHGYLYGSAGYALADIPYPADVQAAAKAGTLKPNDDTFQNPSYAFGAGNAISTADDLAAWIRALVSGKVFNADMQRQWLASLRAEEADKPQGQKYGYGITQISFGPNTVYFHGGEMPGYNSFIGHDPANDVTLVVWTSLTLSVDGQLPANALMLKLLDRIYTVSPLK